LLQPAPRSHPQIRRRRRQLVRKQEPAPPGIGCPVRGFSNRRFPPLSHV
jgi:hypothetical protein